MAKRWLNSADVEVTDDGAILVLPTAPALLGHADITVTDTSASLADLLAAANIEVPAGARRMVLLPHGAVSMAVGADAVVGSGEIDQTVAYTVGLAGGVPDLRLVASESTTVTVKIEG